ncbi:MAG TPA: hypothetical protein VFW98_14685 [Gemmatimonadaceae bacterium]|nr:hypothetical protein [Gemmatimonadaceae bacterium]
MKPTSSDARLCALATLDATDTRPMHAAMIAQHRHETIGNR